MPAGNHGSCINQNKYRFQDDEYNYHEFPQVHRMEGIGRYRSENLLDQVNNFMTFYRQ